MSRSNLCGLSIEPTSRASLVQFQKFSPSQEVLALRVAPLASLFTAVKQRCGYFLGLEPEELGPHCSLDSVVVERAHCPLRERRVAALQSLQGRSIIKGFAEH